MREPVRQRAVVGEQQRTGRVGVEPPDRDDTLRHVDQLDDRRTPLRIAGGRDRSGRLVEQRVGQLLGRHGLAVDLDAVACRHEGVQLARVTVDRDPAGLDQLVGAAP